MFKTCEEAVEWIMGRQGMQKGFEHFQAFIQEHNPNVEKLKYIHIAGTNGKGSTCNFICDCLMEAGYRVGVLSSPHLIHHRDRITINHEWIIEEKLLHIANQRKALWEAYELNMFEIDFDIMVNYFHEMEVDFVVLEVGLGGRLDSTNVITSPLASVIVSIGLDHMDRLGNTLSLIAIEKAGIIKQEGLLVCGENNTEALNSITQVCDEKKANLFPLQKITPIEGVNHFVYRDHLFELAMPARYQQHNAACAIETLHQLVCRQEITLSYAQMQEAMKKSSWSGRFEIIDRKPLTIVDGAHNVHGIHAMLNSLSSLPKPHVVVFSALKDKDVHEMLSLIAQSVDQLILTEFDFYRAIRWDTQEVNYPIIKEVTDAMSYAKSLAQEGTIVVCGSLYFISEVMKNKKNET